jgi:hypothetical protein
MMAEMKAFPRIPTDYHMDYGVLISFPTAGPCVASGAYATLILMEHLR